LPQTDHPKSCSIDKARNKIDGTGIGLFMLG
jgi:hypothetical protein